MDGWRKYSLAVLFLLVVAINKPLGLGLSEEIIKIVVYAVIAYFGVNLAMEKLASKK